MSHSNAQSSHHQRQSTATASPPLMRRLTKGGRSISFRVVVGAGRVGTAVALSNLVDVYQRSLIQRSKDRVRAEKSKVEEGGSSAIECVLLVEKDKETVESIRRAVSNVKSSSSSSTRSSAANSFSSSSPNSSLFSVLPLTHTYNKGRVGGGITHNAPPPQEDPFSGSVSSSGAAHHHPISGLSPISKLFSDVSSGVLAAIIPHYSINERGSSGSTPAAAAAATTSTTTAKKKGKFQLVGSTTTSASVVKEELALETMKKRHEGNSFSSPSSCAAASIPMLTACTPEEFEALVDFIISSQPQPQPQATKGNSRLNDAITDDDNNNRITNSNIGNSDYGQGREASGQADRHLSVSCNTTTAAARASTSAGAAWFAKFRDFIATEDGSGTGTLVTSPSDRNSAAQSSITSSLSPSNTVASNHDDTMRNSHPRSLSMSVRSLSVCTHASDLLGFEGHRWHKDAPVGAAGAIDFYRGVFEGETEGNTTARAFAREARSYRESFGRTLAKLFAHHFNHPQQPLPSSSSTLSVDFFTRGLSENCSPPSEALLEAFKEKTTPTTIIDDKNSTNTNNNGNKTLNDDDASPLGGVSNSGSEDAASVLLVNNVTGPISPECWAFESCTLLEYLSHQDATEMAKVSLASSSAPCSSSTSSKGENASYFAELEEIFNERPRVPEFGLPPKSGTILFVEEKRVVKRVGITDGSSSSSSNVEVKDAILSRERMGRPCSSSDVRLESVLTSLNSLPSNRSTTAKAQASIVNDTQHPHHRVSLLSHTEFVNALLAVLPLSAGVLTTNPIQYAMVPPASNLAEMSEIDWATGVDTTKNSNIEGAARATVTTTATIAPPEMLGVDHDAVPLSFSTGHDGATASTGGVVASKRRGGGGQGPRLSFTPSPHLGGEVEGGSEEAVDMIAKQHTHKSFSAAAVHPREKGSGVGASLSLKASMTKQPWLGGRSGLQNSSSSSSSSSSAVSPLQAPLGQTVHTAAGLLAVVSHANTVWERMLAWERTVIECLVSTAASSNSQDLGEKSSSHSQTLSLSSHSLNTSQNTATLTTPLTLPLPPSAAQQAVTNASISAAISDSSNKGFVYGRRYATFGGSIASSVVTSFSSDSSELHTIESTTDALLRLCELWDCALMTAAEEAAHQFGKKRTRNINIYSGSDSTSASSAAAVVGSGEDKYFDIYASSFAAQQYGIKKGDLRHKARVDVIRALIQRNDIVSNTVNVNNEGGTAMQARIVSDNVDEVEAFEARLNSRMLQLTREEISKDATWHGVSIGDVRTAIACLYTLVTPQRGIGVSLANHGRSLRRPDVLLSAESYSRDQLDTSSSANPPAPEGFIPTTPTSKFAQASASSVAPPTPSSSCFPKAVSSANEESLPFRSFHKQQQHHDASLLNAMHSPLRFDAVSVDVAQSYWALAEEDAMKAGPAYQKMRKLDMAALRSEGNAAFAEAIEKS